MQHQGQELTGAAGGIQGYNIDFHVVLALTPCDCSSAVGPAAAALRGVPNLHELPARGSVQREAQRERLALTSELFNRANACKCAGVNQRL